MSAAHCREAALVEARRDGRLAATGVASMERHLRSCATCATHAADLVRIGEALRQGDDDISPLDHRRARVALLRKAAVSPPPRRRRPMVSFALAAAVLLMAAAAAATVGPRWVGAEPPPMPALASQPAELRLGAEAGSRFVRSTDGGVEAVVLHEGAVHAEVRNLVAIERLVVRTRDAEVEGRGASFRVEARDGVLGAVDVREGIVQVRVGAKTTLVEAGGAWRPAPTDPSPPVPPTPVAPARPAAAPPGGGATTKPLYEAIAAIERGDYGQAARHLEKARAAENDPERAEIALYLHGVALQRAGRTSEARQVARDYLQRHPGGRFAPEALRLSQSE